MIELKDICEVTLFYGKTGKTIAKEKVGASSEKEAPAIARNPVEEKKIWPTLKSSQDHEKEAMVSGGTVLT